MTTIYRDFAKLDKSKSEYEQEETIYYLSLYFHSFGLSEDKAAQLAGQVTCDTLNLSDQSQVLRNAAMDKAMEIVNRWLDDISSSVPDSSEVLRLQLAWFLCPVLARHSEDFGRCTGLHEDFQQAIRDAGKVILPLMSPTEMPPQKLGEMPRLWYRLIGYFNYIWERATKKL